MTLAPPILSFGARQEVISRNIEALTAAGAPPSVAKALAYKQARRSGYRDKRRRR